MTIGIIGSGHIGGTLTRKLTALGNTIYIANSRGPASLAELARQTGAIPASVTEAVQKAELIIITIPQKSIPDLPDNLFADPERNVPVIDTCNYFPKMRDGEIESLEQGLPDSEWVQQQVGHPVVKVFNNIAYTSLADGSKPKGTSGRIGLPVASDDEQAKAVVMRLVDELGFDPVDGGTIKESWRQQPGTDIYCTDLSANDVTDQLAQMGSLRSPEQFDAQTAKRSSLEGYVLKMFRT